MSERAVRPRDAASLIMFRERRGELEVLLGRRDSRHVFLPHFYVFPGGRLDPDDRTVVPAEPLPEAQRSALGRRRPKDDAQAFALAALRETAEETGLTVGKPGAAPPGRGAGWELYRQAGLRPNLGPLSYVGRAITPAESPVRYHNRFFLVHESHVQGELRSNGELLDLGWRRISEAFALGLVDVTEFMLGEAMRQHLVGGRSALKKPLFSYRRGSARAHYL